MPVSLVEDEERIKRSGTQSRGRSNDLPSGLDVGIRKINKSKITS